MQSQNRIPQTLQVAACERQTSQTAVDVGQNHQTQVFRDSLSGNNPLGSTPFIFSTCVKLTTRMKKNYRLSITKSQWLTTWGIYVVLEKVEQSAFVTKIAL